MPKRQRYRALVLVDGMLEEMTLWEAGSLPEQIEIIVTQDRLGRGHWYTQPYGKENFRERQGRLGQYFEGPNAIFCVFDPKVKSQARKAKRIAQEVEQEIRRRAGPEKLRMT